ncbi:hypothetical protein [Glaciihabitans sp. UYNi722]|uniref:type II toxin-antitoxin system Phd/YefM family antitoxin n=1 Tax=Glaciihabitans sp. UYNi722 TaxID=3156344 RepID=UPI003399CACA
MKHQSAQRQTVGIRELKQNPSEVIAKAAKGVQFDVLSNGKSVGVVIQRTEAVRSRWVSSDALKALAAVAGSAGGTSRAGSTDTTGWADDFQAQRELDNDPIVDPWAERDAATA